MKFDESLLYNIKSDYQGIRYSLFDLATWKNGLAFKKIDFSDKGLPVIKIAELNNGISSNTSFTQGDYGEDVFVQWDDLLFSWSGNPQTSINVFRYRLPDGWLNQHIFKVTANSELVTKDFLYYWYSTFLEKWSQKMLIFGVKSSFLELGILAVQKRELIIEEVHCQTAHCGRC